MAFQIYIVDQEKFHLIPAQELKFLWWDGVTSSDFSSETLWLWALERDILITAQHIPGVSNTVADFESRLERDRSDWKPAHEVLQKINQVFGLLEVDLFAS